MMKDTLEILVICHTKYLIFVTIVYIPVMNQVGLRRWLSGLESACSARDVNSDPGLRRFPGEGNGNPLQYSYLGDSMDRGAWQARVHGVAEELNTTEPLNNHNNDSDSRTSQGARWK